MHDTFTARIFLDMWFIYRGEYCVTVGYVPKARTISSCWVYVPPESMERKFNDNNKKNLEKKMEGVLL